jgi:hypothetical protein
VPAGCQVTLVANGRVVSNPKLLEQVDGTGIDCVHLCFLTVDEKDEGKTDQAVSHLTHFPNLIHLNLDRSEATDWALAHNPKMPRIMARSGCRDIWKLDAQFNCSISSSS